MTEEIKNWIRPIICGLIVALLIWAFKVFWESGEVKTYVIDFLITFSPILIGLLAFFAYWFVRDYRKINRKVKGERGKNLEKKPESRDINTRILFQIIKLRSLNLKATPYEIANRLNDNPEIVLAHLRKLCGDQIVTHITGGLPPTLDTDFFLTVDDEVFQKIIEQ